MMRWVMVVFAGVMLSSCVGPCTLIGCVDSVTFQLGTAVQQFGVNEAVTVKACIGTNCVNEVVTRTDSSGAFGSAAFTVGTDGTLSCRFNTSPGPGPQTVTLQLTRNGNVVLDQTREGVPFTESHPNGPACSPTCRTASITL